MAQIKIEITGLKELMRNFKKSPQILNEETETALKKSLTLIERNVKMRTPVDYGRLRTSIGGAEGWRWVREKVASIGTNVKYAFWVEVKPARHKTGESHYFEKGVKASFPGISKIFEQAMQRFAKRVTKK